MKLPIFLKTVDENTNKLSHEKLERFIHELARRLPENCREEFVSDLKMLNGDSAEAIVVDDGYLSVESEIDDIIGILEKLGDGERCLDSEYNEEWDDWYNSDADEILYSDPQKIMVDVSRAIELVHTCVDMELYSKGIELVDALVDIEVFAHGDCEDFYGYEPFRIAGLYEYGLLHGKFEDLVKECLYLIYMGNELPNRATKMYAAIVDMDIARIKLEDVLQIGNQEMPEFDEFLPLWIELLGEETDGRAEALLNEAQSMVQDDSVLLEIARRYVEIHPSLYRQLFEMKMDSGEDERMLEIGLEALEKIPVSYKIRGEIAVQTASYAVKSDKNDVAEQCWMEAFRSNPGIVNYMRICFLSGEPNCFKADIEKTIETIKDREREYCFMMFFEQQFDKMEKTGMRAEPALGWSATFMKEGMALMLLMLYEGTDLPEGMCAMRDRVMLSSRFSACDLYCGTYVSDYKSDMEEFFAIFDSWKSTVELSDQEREKWLEKIALWMSKRTEAITLKGRTKYYGECASYIAAIGEVRQSRGDIGAKARIMEQYRREYPKHRSFHAELRRFGMKK